MLVIIKDAGTVKGENCSRYPLMLGFIYAMGLDTTDWQPPSLKMVDGWHSILDQQANWGMKNQMRHTI